MTPEIVIKLPNVPTSIRQLNALKYFLASPSIDKYSFVKLHKHQQYLRLKFKPEYLVEIYTSNRGNVYLRVYEILEDGNVKLLKSYWNDEILKAVQEFNWLIKIIEVQFLVEKFTA